VNNEHVKSSASIDIFKERLKTELFACYSSLHCNTVSQNDSFEFFVFHYLSIMSP